MFHVNFLLHKSAGPWHKPGTMGAFASSSIVSDPTVGTPSISFGSRTFGGWNSSHALSFTEKEVLGALRTPNARTRTSVN